MSKITSRCEFEVGDKVKFVSQPESNYPYPESNYPEFARRGIVMEITRVLARAYPTAVSKNLYQTRCTDPNATRAEQKKLTVSGWCGIWWELVEAAPKPVCVCESFDLLAVGCCCGYDDLIKESKRV